MANHLSNETSPYLQQHQDNPVNWYPWGQTALEKAQKENKPIFLSIGYSACHWCHVMAHESFEDAPTARLLNENFVSIKVDREERPDLDDIYMQAVVLLTGQGGWPLSVFLTPQLQPFYGGTYFPPLPSHGMPSFTQLLNAILEAWKSQPESIRKNAEMLTKAVQSKQTHQGETPNLDAVVTQLYTTFDWNTGGWGRAPKFPQPMLIEFLIQRALGGNPQASEMASYLLQHMAQGGMYDLVGGGFHRYSTDAHWLIPHFEKMLYDNAQLALAYLHGFALSGNTRFQEVVEDTLNFIHREMTSPEGGFFASMDADTFEGEGRYYAWQMDELQKLLTEEELSTMQKITQISTKGNFDLGLNVLRIIEPSQADQKLLPDFRLILRKLKTARDQRTPPGKDQKIITEWNAMAIRAFAEAGLLLNRADYLQIAKNAAAFLLENLTAAEGRLHRSWRDGKASQPGTLSDYTALIAALHSVYVIDFEPHIYRHMRSLLTILEEDFASDDSLYEDASTQVANLFVRPRNLQDNATPSGNAMGAYIHWLFANYEHDPNHLNRANQMLKQVGKALENYPTSFGYWLQVAERITNTTQQIALVSPDVLTALGPFLAIYRETFRPNSIIATKYQWTLPDDCYPGVLDDRPAINHKPTAYVCEGFTCLVPTTTPQEFKQQLN